LCFTEAEINGAKTLYLKRKLFNYKMNTQLKRNKEIELLEQAITLAIVSQNKKLRIQLKTIIFLENQSIWQNQTKKKKKLKLIRKKIIKVTVWTTQVLPLHTAIQQPIPATNPVWTESVETFWGVRCFACRLYVVAHSTCT
jgi:hypothetical protein